MYVWPEENIVVNVIPDSEVVIRELPPNSTVAVEIEQHSTAIGNIPSVGGKITVPSETFVDAFVNRLSLRLVVDGNYNGGTISFLPRQESEHYDLKGFWRDGGDFSESGAYSATRLISVEDVEDIVITTTTLAASRALICFDDNKNFVRVLLANGEFTNQHIVPDGSYRYIASSSYNGGQSPSLVLYFRRRRR